MGLRSTMFCFGDCSRSARRLRSATTSSADSRDIRIDEEATRAIRTNQDVQRLTSSFNNLNFPPDLSVRTQGPTLCLHQQPVGSRPRITWYDLPMEILVCIAKETIIPQETTASDQHPSDDEINSIFGQIDKRTRQAFFYAIQQDCLFLKLRFHHGEMVGFDRDFNLALEKYFSSSKSKNLHDASRAAGYRASSVRMEFHVHLDDCARLTSEATVCATRWNITLVRSLLVVQRDWYRDIIIDCHGANPARTRDINTILEDSAKVTRGMTFVGVFPTPNTTLSRAASYPTSMTKKVDDAANLEIHGTHLRWIGEAIRYKRIHMILPYAVEVGMHHLRCFGPINPLRYHYARARQQVTYITLVLKGFSAWLLLQPNNQQQQSHDLFVDGSWGGSLRRACVNGTDRCRAALERRGWNYRSEKTGVLLRAVFSMLQARAEYEIGLARTATLPNASAIGEYVKRGKDHQLGKLDVDDHIKLSGEMRASLSWMYKARLEREGEMSPGLMAYMRWNDMMTTLTFEVELALVRRTEREKLRSGIMEEPVRREYVEGFECAWVFSGDE